MPNISSNAAAETAAIYIRTSTSDQDGAAQLHALHRAAAARGWNSALEYTDLGHSGAKAHRPALNALRRAAKMLLGTWSWGARGWESDSAGDYAAVVVLDNRRLFVFQEAGVPIRTVPATAAEVAAEAWKFTTTNEGTSIIVRGGP